jgi:hypothetical protein
LFTALVAAVAPASAAAQSADGFCGELREVVAAARDAPPFASLPPPTGREGRRVLGFAVCGARSRDADAHFVCSSPTEDREWQDQIELASRIEQCLPGAVRAGEEIGDRDGAGPEGVRRPRIAMGVPVHSILIDAGGLRFTVVRPAHPRVWNVVLTVHRLDAAETD